MRRHFSSIAALPLALAMTTYGLAQPAGESTVDDATHEAAAPADHHAVEPHDSASAPAIVQLEVWLALAPNEFTSDELRQLTAPLASRDDAMTRDEQLRQQGDARCFYLLGTTLAGKDFTYQLGSREPRITGVSNAPRGRSRSIQFEDVGARLRAKVEVVGESTLGIRMMVESSYLDDSGVAIESDEQGNEVTAMRSRQFVHECVVPCRSGKPVIALVSSTTDGNHTPSAVLYVMATLVESEH